MMRRPPAPQRPARAAVLDDDEVPLSAALPEEVGHRARRPFRAGDPRRVPPARPVRRRRGDATSMTTAVQWGAVLTLATVVAGLLTVWTAVQLTSRGNAERVLRDALVPITEVDTWMARELPALREAALADPAALEGEPLPRFPLLVLASAATLTQPDAAVRAWLLETSAAAVYASGAAAFQREPGAGGGVFSARGSIRWTVGQLTHDFHQIVVILLGVALVVALPLAAMVTLAASGLDRLRNVGLALALGAVPLTVAWVGVRFGLRAMADGREDPFSVALLGVAADVSGVPLRNAIVFAVAGLLLVGLVVGARLAEGPAGGRLGDRNPGLR